MGETWGQVVLRYRRDRGLTQDELSRRTGITKKFISRIENNKVKKPGPDTIRRLIDHLEIPFDEMASKLGLPSRNERDWRSPLRRDLEALGATHAEIDHIIKTVEMMRPKQP